jgi:hypothetical protein
VAVALRDFLKQKMRTATITPSTTTPPTTPPAMGPAIDEELGDVVGEAVIEVATVMVVIRDGDEVVDVVEAVIASSGTIKLAGQ